MNRNQLSILGILSFLFGLYITIKMFPSFIYSFNEPVDLYGKDTNYNEISKNEFVTADIDFVYGCYAYEKYIEEYHDGRDKSEDTYYYYAIPVYTDEEMFVAGLKIDDADADTLNEIVEETQAFLSGEKRGYGYTKYNITGKFFKMDKEIYQYMKEAFGETGLTESEMEEILVPYYLDSASPSMTRKYFKYGPIFLIIGIILMLLYNPLEEIAYLYDRKTQKARYADISIENDAFIINGKIYDKSLFKKVDEHYKKDNKIYAAQAFAEITGIEFNQANEIIDKWKDIYHTFS